MYITYNIILLLQVMHVHAPMPETLVAYSGLIDDPLPFLILYKHDVLDHNEDNNIIILL